MTAPRETSFGEGLRRALIECFEELLALSDAEREAMIAGYVAVLRGEQTEIAGALATIIKPH